MFTFVGDLDETKPASEAAERVIAKYTLTEINRIIADLAEPAQLQSPRSGDARQ